MGLTSAMNTALTGMSAAETMIDVDGNNIANSNTVGFKSSTATFATQFLQTQGLGSAPSLNNGGTDPRQIGMGTMVASITPNFNQGTIEISSDPTDMAIQGDGFFIVTGRNGGQNYTRNGVFKLNAQNQLSTSTGNLVLGYGVDNNYNIQSTQLVPISIPLGAAAVAKATENVFLQGTLSPTGDLATDARIIQTGVLGDASFTRPVNVVMPEISPTVALGAATTAPHTAGPGLAVGNYFYQVAFSDTNPPTSISQGAYTTPAVEATTDALNDAVTLPLTGLSPGSYKFANIYRSTTGTAGTFQLLDTVAVPAPVPPATTPVVPNYEDNGSQTPGAAAITDTPLTDNYTYYIAYADANGTISRPCDALAGVDVQNGYVHFPTLPLPNPNPNNWTQYVIYRNYPTITGGLSKYVEVDRVNFNDPNQNYTDHISDQTLSDRANDPLKNWTLNFNGPPATGQTRLVDLLNDIGGTNYQYVFPSTGTMQFTGEKPVGSKLAEKDMVITVLDPLLPPSPNNRNSTVNDLLTFMSESLGIQKRTATNGIPPSRDAAKSTVTDTFIDPGAYINGGVISIVGNNGVDNGVDINVGDIHLATPAGVSSVNLPFGKYQDAKGESATADAIVYDSLGIACNVRITMDLETKVPGSANTFRWFADSSANELPTGEPTIAVGTGLISFDGQGNFISATNSTIAIYRSREASVSPLTFKMDFSKISGLSAPQSTIQVARQDGSPPGTLTSFIVGEDGLITGVFSNGISRNLAQVRLARFGNPAGLEQLGQNLFATGVNSGLPIQGNPGQEGIGKIVAGAVELSNTDIGANLTDLILASTMYRGNARVITTTEQLFDELLALKR